MVLNPFGSQTISFTGLTTDIYTLQFITKAKLLLWSSNKNNLIFVGGHLNSRNCIIGSQYYHSVKGTSARLCLLHYNSEDTVNQEYTKRKKKKTFKWAVKILLYHKGFSLFSVNMDRSGSKGDKREQQAKYCCFYTWGRQKSKEHSRDKPWCSHLHVHATGATPGHTEWSH